MTGSRRPKVVPAGLYSVHDPAIDGSLFSPTRIELLSAGPLRVLLSEHPDDIADAQRLRCQVFNSDRASPIASATTRVAATQTVSMTSPSI